MNYQPGDSVRFTYHCWESPLSADAELWRHPRQRAVILRRLDNIDEEDVGGPMYHIQFADGYEHSAFTDELRPKRARGEG